MVIPKVGKPFREERDLERHVECSDAARTLLAQPVDVRGPIDAKLLKGRVGKREPHDLAHAHVGKELRHRALAVKPRGAGRNVGRQRALPPKKQRADARAV